MAGIVHEKIRQSLQAAEGLSHRVKDQDLFDKAFGSIRQYH
jgi:hypothetical protein